MEWNNYAIGGEVCLDPDTKDPWAKIMILDRRTGISRSGPMTADELDELIEGFTRIREAITPKDHPHD
jgi:hypothetical protein